MQNLSNPAVAWLPCPSRINSLYPPVVHKAVYGYNIDYTASKV